MNALFAIITIIIVILFFAVNDIFPFRSSYSLLLFPAGDTLEFFAEDASFECHHSSAGTVAEALAYFAKYDDSVQFSSEV